MIRRYHSNIRIFFDNPYVVRTSYEHSNYSANDVMHRGLVKKAYKMCQGTWGHTAVIADTIYKVSPTPPPGKFAGFSIFDDCYIEHRAWFCFQNELDALQFRLTLDTLSVHVNLWPNTLKFIIHEVVE